MLLLGLCLCLKGKYVDTINYFNSNIHQLLYTEHYRYGMLTTLGKPCKMRTHAYSQSLHHTNTVPRQFKSVHFLNGCDILTKNIYINTINIHFFQICLILICEISFSWAKRLQSLPMSYWRDDKLCCVPSLAATTVYYSFNNIARGELASKKGGG